MRNFVQKVFNFYVLVLTAFDARDVFCCPRVAELPACVLSVAGAMRTGKSFLLDQMVSSALSSLDCQALQHNCQLQVGWGTWLGLILLAMLLTESSPLWKGHQQCFRFKALPLALVLDSRGEGGWPGTPVGFIFVLRSLFSLAIFNRFDWSQT